MYSVKKAKKKEKWTEPHGSVGHHLHQVCEYMHRGKEQRKGWKIFEDIFVKIMQIGFKKYIGVHIQEAQQTSIVWILSIIVAELCTSFISISEWYAIEWL